MHPRTKVTDEALRDALAETNSTVALARRFGMSERAIATRLRRLGVQPLKNWKDAQKPPLFKKLDGRLDIEIIDGIAIVGGDAHYWPGMVSTAHRAFVWACRELRPRVVCLNGDIVDGATIHRHGRIGWEAPPNVLDELKVVQERLTEIEAAAPHALRVWNRGNHDNRFESSLSAAAPQFAGVQGFSLQDHFPLWRMQWATWINAESPSPTVIKHRWRGGEHAAYNNTLRSGVNLVTNHLHRLTVTSFSDYRGTRWGVDCGFLADSYGPQFANYTELSPTNWASGFAVLSWRDGRLLYPELVHVVDEGVVSFRGELIRV